MNIQKNVLSIIVGGVAAVSFMLSCGETGSDTFADAGQTCGECTVSGPVTLEGPVSLVQPVQVKTADTDAARIVDGTVIPETSGSKLADGPLILTDLMAPNTFNLGAQTFRAQIYIDSTDPKDCHGSPTPIAAVILSDTKQSDMHGGRLLVKAGDVLCAQGDGSILVSWSGFRPYE